MKFVVKFVLIAAILSLARYDVLAAEQHVIVVVGAEGTPEYGQMFNQWADQWEAAATAGGAAFEIIGRGDSNDSLQQLQQKVAAAIQTPSSEPFWLILIGHGTFDGRTPRFNLRGPDLSAETAAEMLAVAQRPVAVINCSSCSAPFINALSAPNRIVMTGTKDGNEIQFTRFGGFLAEAIGKLDADIDRDGQTSLLEGWLFASRRTEEFYKSDGRLATEHSLLDDSGDSKGTRAELFEGVRIKDTVKDKDTLDGKLSRRWHLVRSQAERSLTPEQRGERDRLEEDLEKLRERKSDLPEADYLLELEKILIPLARLYEDTDTPNNK
jgi:hypothetical protein